MMILYKAGALLCLASFYSIYFIKMILQKRKGIDTDQIGKGDKTGRVLIVERVMKFFSFATPVAQLFSIIYGKSVLGVMGKVLGMYCCIISVIVFFLAVYTMKDSWRAGIPSEDKTKIITNGIYKYSRNPAFVGFDLMYAGIALMYCNIVVAILGAGAIVSFHFQILEEEKFLASAFGKEYEEYKSKTHRYFGNGKVCFDSVIRDIYVLMFIWGVLYTFTCVAYAGIPSFLWLWPCLALWSALRIKMLTDRLEGREKFKIKNWLRVCYRIAVAIMICIFAFGEYKIVSTMNAEPRPKLDYIIVLGAGVNGTVPLRPLRLRIDYAYEYMMDNPNTRLVASGGQGTGEEISEAECIKRELVKRGIAEDRITLEDKSTSTQENLEFSKQYIEEGASVGVLTNSFHLYRALLIAGKEGYSNVCGLPGKTLYPMGIHYVVREFFGVVRLLM